MMDKCRNTEAASQDISQQVKPLTWMVPPNKQWLQWCLQVSSKVAEEQEKLDLRCAEHLWAALKKHLGARIFIASNVERKKNHQNSRNPRCFCKVKEFKENQTKY